MIRILLVVPYFVPNGCVNWATFSLSFTHVTEHLWAIVNLWIVLTVDSYWSSNESPNPNACVELHSTASSTGTLYLYLHLGVPEIRLISNIWFNTIFFQVSNYSGTSWYNTPNSKHVHSSYKRKQGHPEFPVNPKISENCGWRVAGGEKKSCSARQIS